VSHLGEDLTALLDGALDGPRRAEAEAHLAGCPACRAERDRLAGALARLAALPPPAEPSPWFETRLEARLAEREAAPPAGLLARLAAWRWRLALPAAALGAAAALALFTIRHQRAARAEALALVVSGQLELMEDLEAAASAGDVETAEDAAVVASLDELDLREGRP
jgi:anti-sigma factor RsiW